MIQYLLTKKQANNTAYYTPLSMNPLPQITKDWTLFLDRDGVINEEVIGDYIRTWQEFTFKPGSLEAIALLTPLFKRIIIITNQKGVGKGFMTLEALRHIHDHMQNEILTAGGNIDKVYFCTSLDNNDINLKPNTGMALHAKADFPEIDFSKSIVVGNMPNDLLLGRAIGAFNIYIHTRDDETPDPSTIDREYKDLLSFASAISSQQETQ